MAKLITAIFKTRTKALQAVEDLIGHDFAEEDISLLMSDSSRGREFAMKEATKAPEGMALGAAIGGVIGATALALSSAGLVAIPGMNVIVSGQWISLMAGFGMGSLAGGLIGGMAGLGVPEHEAAFSTPKLDRAGILLGVFMLDEKRIHEAQQLLAANGAQWLRIENAQKTDSKTA